MAEKKTSVHREHRKRVKSRFRSEGLDHFDEVHVLELLLFYGIPQGDTNPLAHRLIEHFGSLTQVLEAPAEELERISGVGEHVSTLLNLTRDITRYYYKRIAADPDEVLTTTADCGRYLMGYFLGRRDETVFLLCLDAKCKPICCREVGSGSVTSASVSPRKVVETALSVNAATVILAHNHPGGFAFPSDDDVLTTKRIALALDTVGIVLADHIVVADNDFVSIAESGLYRPGECSVML